MGSFVRFNLPRKYAPEHSNSKPIACGITNIDKENNTGPYPAQMTPEMVPVTRIPERLTPAPLVAINYVV